MVVGGEALYRLLWFTVIFNFIILKNAEALIVRNIYIKILLLFIL